MKTPNFLLLLSISLGMISCSGFGLFSSTPSPAKPTSLFPGEALGSPVMEYVKGENSYEYTLDSGSSMAFDFIIDFNVEHRVLSTSLWGTWKKHGYVPSDDVFDQFGTNKNAVKEEYERVLGMMRDGHEESTVLYNGGLSLTANKDFAGIPAGENLAILMEPHMNPSLIGWNKEDLDLSYGSNVEFTEAFVNQSFYFKIPVGDYHRVNEDVTFQLTIPVKVVHYLHWLNDCLQNQAADITWHTENLTCSFTIHKNLRK